MLPTQQGLTKLAPEENLARTQEAMGHIRGAVPRAVAPEGREELALELGPAFLQIGGKFPRIGPTGVLRPGCHVAGGVAREGYLDGRPAGRRGRQVILRAGRGRQEKQGGEGNGRKVSHGPAYHRAPRQGT